MPRRTVVLDVVGLSPSLLGETTPRLNRFLKENGMRRIVPDLPAVTCTVQSSIVTGLRPSGHGVVGNGWYDRESAEVRFWRQSNRLVKGEKVWEAARRRDPGVTCSKMFWWYNMYSSADFSVTPRPIYKADGRKLPDVYSHPADLRDRLQAELGSFPLFSFWGPGSSIESSRWIAEASMRVCEWRDPTLTLVYLPHLDYALQKFGPAHPEISRATTEIDAVVGRMIDYHTGRGDRILILSEYGIEAVDRPIEINRALREAGLLEVRVEEGLELLDPGASRAFAVADHQIAHVYADSPASLERAREVCRNLAGVEHCLDRAGQAAFGLDHERSGDLVSIARQGAWFCYPYWLEEDRAPDFARTVDIHRKPGYDPLELFLDPSLRFPKFRIAKYLLLKKFGFRGLLEVIPLDPGLVRGSHGRMFEDPDLQPILIGPEPFLPDTEEIPCTKVRDVILRALFDREE